MSELAEDLLTGDGTKRAKIGVNAFMHGGAGAFYAIGSTTYENLQPPLIWLIVGLFSPFQ